jgi:hypothetical protein
MIRPAYEIGGPLEDADTYRSSAEDFILKALHTICFDADVDTFNLDGVRQAHIEATAQLAQALVYIRIAGSELSTLAERGGEVKGGKS